MDADGVGVLGPDEASGEAKAVGKQAGKGDDGKQNAADDHHPLPRKLASPRAAEQGDAGNHEADEDDPPPADDENPAPARARVTLPAAPSEHRGNSLPTPPPHLQNDLLATPCHPLAHPTRFRDSPTPR